jgi:hypothetical protein
MNARHRWWRAFFIGGADQDWTSMASGFAGMKFAKFLIFRSFLS